MRSDDSRPPGPPEDPGQLPASGRAEPHGARYPGGNLAALRGHNASMVLDLLRGAGDGGVSRLELAAGTGLTPQAVSKIVARLRAAGLVADAGLRASTGGKRATVLRLVPDAAGAVGLQLDRDALVAVRTDLTGTVVAEHRAPLDLGAGAGTVLAAAVRAVASVTGERAPLGVGVAAPGPLDHRAGVLRRVTGHPEWDGFPLRDLLARRFGLPVVVDKDTNAAALGLALHRGAGRGAPALGGPAALGGLSAFAYLHLGTGLGAGLVLGGELYRGPRTGAGEFGHQVVQLDGPPCPCGNRGCVEAICLRAVREGALGEAARVLGEAAANLVSLLDVERVLLGGRLVFAHRDLFARGVTAVLTERVRRGGLDRAVPVTIAPGDDRLVAQGAAHLLLAPLFGRAGDMAVGAQGAAGLLG
ncbi:ROK family transcriptional regulator [Streptomyces sp. NPDC050560]|uniref:ROK family transcriptional regulator n=1 Tax=Streptomyces sp. NPDC050560 TaxID=3365630 RepID=UPI00379A1BF0